MAIRKPDWDMSLSEIERRAKGVVTDRDWYARQTRADSAATATATATASAEAVEREVVRELIKRMSADQIDAYIAAKSADPSTDITSFVRADAVGGLKMVEHLDDAGRPIRTFRLEGKATKKSTWMAPYMSEAREMVMLNRKNIPVDQFDKTEAAWRADRARREQAARAIAEGKDVLCDLSYTCYDLQG